ncbi:hypothetical protein ACHQM5_006073 [Ranunculus cassubicifolius]
MDVSPNEPGGTLIFPIRRVSICIACCTPNVPAAHTGSILIRLFNCSTCSTLHNLHSFIGSPLSQNTSRSVIIAALSRYLNLSV